MGSRARDARREVYTGNARARRDRRAMRGWKLSERARTRDTRESSERFEAGVRTIGGIRVTVSGRSQSLQTSETLNTKPTMRSSISVRYNLPDSGNSLLRLASNLVVLLAVLLVAQELRVHLRASTRNARFRSVIAFAR